MKTMTTKILFMLLVTLLFFDSIAEAAIYYVDYTAGNDNNSGISQSASWKHSPGMAGATGTAASTTLQPGDTVYFKKGAVWPAAALPLILQYSGSSGNPITYTTTNWGTGNYPTFDAENTDMRCITYSGTRSYIVINGLELKNPATDGGYRWAVELHYGGNKTIQNSKLFAGGILVQSCGSCTVRNNKIDFNNVGVGEEAPTIMVLYSATSGTVVRGNEIYGFNYAAIKTGGSVSDRPSNLIIEKNYIHSPGTPTTLQVGIIFRDSDNSVYRYNIIDLHSSSMQASELRGMASWDAGGGNKIYNNTIVMNGFGTGVHTGVQDNNTLRNNIIYEPDSAIYVASGTGTNADYNLLYGHNSLYSGGSITWGSNNITTSAPMFVNVAFSTNSDFQLQAGSPAINSGTLFDNYHNGVNKDYWGTITPQLSAPAVGASEYLTGGQAAIPPAPPQNLRVQ